MGASMTNLDLLTLYWNGTHLLRRANPFHGQMRILSLLRERGTVTQRLLADLLDRRPATLSVQLDDMEKLGYVKRVKRSDDKRNIDVSLTDDGLKAAYKADIERKKIAESHFSILTEEERDVFAKLLLKLERAWENME